MNFWDVFGEMLVILFAIAAGYAANRLGYLGGEADQKVSKLLLNITKTVFCAARKIAVNRKCLYKHTYCIFKS